MNKFCFTQSESNKFYCKTQSSIIYIPLLIFFLLLCQYLQLTPTVWELFSPTGASTSFLCLPSCQCQDQILNLKISLTYLQNELGKA